MTFRAGDWVRRKAGRPNPCWVWGSAPVQVDTVIHQGGCVGDFTVAGSSEEFCMENCELVSADSFDRHALGMALELAHLLTQDGAIADPTNVAHCDALLHVADWLRACVTQELLSQPEDQS